MYQIRLGFVRFEEKECGYDSTNELESFNGLNDSTIPHDEVRDECEDCPGQES